jgi:dephospho-CoA kinase
MHRVMIIGQPGSGKSTLARAMGDITGLPLVHMDQIYWHSDWAVRPTAEKMRFVPMPVNIGSLRAPLGKLARTDRSL